MNNTLKHKSTNSSNNLYMLLCLIGFTSTFALNLSHKLISCSLWFTIIVLVINTLGELFGKKKALETLAICVILSFIAMWKKADLALVGSFISVITACYASLSVRASGGFQVRNFLGLGAAALVDSLMMFITFTILHAPAADKIVNILFKDLMFKFSYISVAAVCLFLALKMIDYKASARAS